MSSQDHRDRTRLENSSLDRRTMLLGGTTLAAAATFAGAAPIQVSQAQAQPTPTGQRPNILVIWGDDIGWQNVSAYGLGTMGYMTPNIDRIGLEGIRFTDHYAQAS